MTLKLVYSFGELKTKYLSYFHTLISSNDLDKLREVIYKLQTFFDLTDFGGPKNFLGITLRKDREKGIISLTQDTYIQLYSQKELLW